jgi:molecular chaperone GrpE
MKRKDQSAPEGVVEEVRPAGTAPAGGGVVPSPQPDAGATEAPDATGAQQVPEAGTAPDREEEATPPEQELLDDLLRQELVALQEDLERIKDQHLRLAADFENYRKRVTAELALSWVRAQAELVRTLVEGLDDLQRVSQFTKETASVDTLIEGVDLVERKLLKALTDAGLEVLTPEGAAFDPNFMEAVMRVPAQGPEQDDMVHQVFQKGYRFKDQLVRPARVSVYKDDD